MKKRFNKISNFVAKFCVFSIATIGIIMCSDSFAQKKPVTINTKRDIPAIENDSGLLIMEEFWYKDNEYTKRKEILKKYGLDSNLSIGWYVGVVDSSESRDLLLRFLPMSNYLTNKLNELSVIVTDKEASSIAQEASNGFFDVIYTSAIEGSWLRNKGWQALVGRSESLTGVVLVLADSKINKIEDVANAKIMAPFGGITTAFVKYKLFEKNMLNKLQFAEVRLSQIELLQIVDSKRIDGVVVRDSIANNLIQKNPGKYKIGFSADVAPGHTIFTSPTFESTKLKIIKDALMSLTNDGSKEQLNILRGLDGYRETDKQPFLERKNEDYDLSNKVFELLKKLPTSTEIDFTK